MPQPHNVKCAKFFPTREQRSAYADGLAAGAGYNRQGYANANYRVRLDDDPLKGFGAYIESLPKGTIG